MLDESQEVTYGLFINSSFIAGDNMKKRKNLLVIICMRSLRAPFQFSEALTSNDHKVEKKSETAMDRMHYMVVNRTSWSFAFHPRPFLFCDVEPASKEKRKEVIILRILASFRILPFAPFLLCRTTTRRYESTYYANIQTRGHAYTLARRRSSADAGQRYGIGSDMTHQAKMV